MALKKGYYKFILAEGRAGGGGVPFNLLKIPYNGYKT